MNVHERPYQEQIISLVEKGKPLDTIVITLDGTNIKPKEIMISLLDNSGETVDFLDIFRLYTNEYFWTDSSSKEILDSLKEILRTRAPKQVSVVWESKSRA